MINTVSDTFIDEPNITAPRRVSRDSFKRIGGGVFFTILTSSVTNGSEYPTFTYHQIEPNVITNSHCISTYDSEQSYSASRVETSLDLSTAKVIERHLTSAGLKPTRTSRTFDDSTLLEFLSSDKQACIDIYDTGEIVVVVRNEPRDDVYEFETSELEQLISLIRDVVKGARV